MNPYTPKEPPCGQGGATMPEGAFYGQERREYVRLSDIHNSSVTGYCGGGVCGTTTLRKTPPPQLLITFKTITITGSLLQAATPLRRRGVLLGGDLS